MSLAVLFQGSRVWFLLHLLPQPLAGRPWILKEAPTTLLIQKSGIKAKSAEATTVLDCAQKIMKCAGLWLCDGTSRGIRTGALRLSAECVSELPCESVLWFYFKPRELSPYRQR